MERRRARVELVAIDLDSQTMAGVCEVDDGKKAPMSIADDELV